MKKIRFFCVGFWLTLILWGGCASQYSEHLQPVRNSFYEGEVTAAREKLNQRVKKAPEKEKDVLMLNDAILEMTDGNIQKAQSNLLTVRDHFEELEAAALKKSTENVLQYWTDDNMTSYPGEDYEKVMLLSMLAISELLMDGTDAQAYAYQISAKQDEIVKRGEITDPNDSNRKINPKLNYPRIPLGPYLQGILWEETYTNQEEAARCYEKVVQWLPGFKQGKIDLERAEKGVHSQPGHGVIYVFAFVGRGPCKEQVDSPATQFSLLIADQIFSACSKYSVPPTLAPVPIPAIVTEETGIHAVCVDVDGCNEAKTETIADINKMARDQFEIIKDQIIARAVMRRIVKKGTIYMAKEIGQVNNWISLAADVGGVVYEASETADTRCWGLLPARIQVARIELPIGQHELSLYACNATDRRLGMKSKVKVNVLNNRNTYVLANFPSNNIIGKIVASSD